MTGWLWDKKISRILSWLTGKMVNRMWEDKKTYFLVGDDGKFHWIILNVMSDSQVEWLAGNLKLETEIFGHRHGRKLGEVVRACEISKDNQQLSATKSWGVKNKVTTRNVFSVAHICPAENLHIIPGVFEKELVAAAAGTGVVWRPRVSCSRPGCCAHILSCCHHQRRWRASGVVCHRSHRPRSQWVPSWCSQGLCRVNGEKAHLAFLVCPITCSLCSLPFVRLSSWRIRDDSSPRVERCCAEPIWIFCWKVWFPSSSFIFLILKAFYSSPLEFNTDLTIEHIFLSNKYWWFFFFSLWFTCEESR